MRTFCFVIATLWLYYPGYGQYPLNGLYTQDFNSLAGTGSNNTFPAGWVFSESGTAADGLYTAGTGSGSTGDTYSFGAASSAERAAGTLQSGSLVSIIGFYLTNSTGNMITRLTVSYTGEQWRLGATGRNDRLDFQFSLNASSLTNGDWADIDALDLIAPVNSGSTGALDGNVVTQQRTITYTISGILIPAGSTFFFRWTDFDAAGADDGLAIDNFSIQPEFTLPSSAFFRTAASGNWSVPAIWEVSTDQLNWSVAAELPTYYSAGIEIRAGHTISYQYFTTVDQVTVSTAATLVHSGGQFIISDGAGDDLQIQNGGVLHLTAAGNAPVFTGAAPVIRIKAGGVLRISAGGLSTVAGAGVHAAGYVYDDGAILENAYNGMGVNGVTYFPNVNSTTIPVLRLTQNISLPVGAAAATRVNGVFEANGNIIFAATGQKIFRNGIRGTGNISTTATCGLLVIDGTSAIIGGNGTINIAASPGLQIGSATGTTVSLLSNKTVTGNVSLLASSTYVELGAYQLTVTGTVSGGGLNSFIRSSSTGNLVLENVQAAGKLFPVGHTRYNPVLIENGGGHTWSVRVNDGVVPDFPYTSQGAVLLTWHIVPSVNPPATGAVITFQFDRLAQTGGLFNTPPFDTEPLQAWHRKNNFWLAAGTPQPLVNAGADIRTVKITGLTEFSPYGLARVSLPLPVKLLSFGAEPVTFNKIKLLWKIAEPVSEATRFIPEFSPDGIRFFPADTVIADTSKSDYILEAELSQADFQYYRLKILEQNGHISFSRIIKPEKRRPGFQVLKVIPNPVINEAAVQVYSDKDRSTKWTIVDIFGKPLSTRIVSIRKGIQQIVADLSALTPGHYMVRILDEQRIYILHLIRQ